MNYEPRAADQVPLLIKMQRSELALQKAIESGDTDLVFLVVLHIKRHSTDGTYFIKYNFIIVIIYSLLLYY